MTHIGRKWISANVNDNWRPSRGTPTNINIYVIFLETIIISAYILTLTVWVYFHPIFSSGLQKTTLFLQEWRFGLSRSSMVIDFGANQKAYGTVCDFLLVRHSNLGPILHLFGDIAGFRCSWPKPYSTLIWRCARSPMLGSMWAGALSYSAAKLFSKYSNLYDHGTWTTQTDRQTTCGITTLCVTSCGKNRKVTVCEIMDCRHLITSWALTNLLLNR